MGHNAKIWVTCSALIAVPLIKGQSSDPRAELDVVRSAIQSGSYDDALQHIRVVTDAAIAGLRQLPPTSEVVSPPPYATGSATQASLLVLVDQTKQAWDTRDLVRVREYSVALGSGIFRLKEQGAPTPAQSLAELEKKSVGASAFQRFLLLPDLSRAAYAAGEINKALAYASELLADATAHARDWPQGAAVFQGNIIAGRVALTQGDISLAKQHLLAAGLTPGSPALDTFGPSMALADELLKKGERAVVVQFLSECGQFWKMDRGRLARWTAMINEGKAPDFRANLRY